MSFDYSTLITDRAEADAEALRAMVKKPLSQWTAAEAEAFTKATLKGSYDYTDLNRVSACMEDLVARLNGLGYQVPGYERVKIERTLKPTSRLPEGYTEVQYIQSSGTQYVDSLFKPNQDTRIEMDVIPLSIAEAGGSSGFIPYGAATSYNSNAFECYTTASKLSFNYDGQYKVDGTVSVGDEIHISHDKNKVVVTAFGEAVTQNTFSFNPFAAPYSLTICGTHRASMLCGHQRVKNCQIYDNDTLIRDFIPCIDPSSTVGLYDTVTKTFFGNSGTGVFLAGPRKVELPVGYTQLEMIQGGDTQYIDSDYKPNQDTTVKLKVKLTQTGSRTLFGTDAGWSANGFALGCTFAHYGSNTDTFVDLNDGALHDVSFAKNVLTIDGVVKCTFDVATFTMGTNMMLFANNRSGTISEYTQMDLYSLRVYDSETLVRDFVPCENSSNEVGLYDLVSGQFYGNAGTGSFTAGDVVTWVEDDASESDTGELDPYTWHVSDAPTESQLARYRANVAAVRGVLALPTGTDQVPDNILTVTEANAIEAVLLVIDQILSNMPSARRHSGVTICGVKGVIA